MESFDNKFLRTVFKEYNEKCFDGKIPNCRCVFADMANRLGNFSQYSQTIRIAYFPTCIGLDHWDEWFLRETVLHEMVHAYIYCLMGGPKRNMHGKDFHDIVRKIRKDHHERTYVDPLAAIHRKSMNPFVRLMDLFSGLMFRYFL